MQRRTAPSSGLTVSEGAGKRWGDSSCACGSKEGRVCEAWGAGGSIEWRKSALGKVLGREWKSRNFRFCLSSSDPGSVGFTSDLRVDVFLLVNDASVLIQVLLHRSTTDTRRVYWRYGHTDSRLQSKTSEEIMRARDGGRNEGIEEARNRTQTELFRALVAHMRVPDEGRVSIRIAYKWYNVAAVSSKSP